MPEIKLILNQVFPAKVIRKDQNVKSWQVKGKPVYRHDIHLEDPKTKNTSVKEWVSSEKEIPLTSCIEGVVQWFKCTRVTEGKNDEIEPYDPEQNSKQSPLKQAAEINNSLPKGTAATDSCQNMNLQGKSITFCEAWAKDLKVAEINKQPEGYKVTPEDISDITKWAIQMNNELCDFLNF